MQQHLEERKKCPSSTNLLIVCKIVTFLPPKIFRYLINQHFTDITCFTTRIIQNNFLDLKISNWFVSRNISILLAPTIFSIDFFYRPDRLICHVYFKINARKLSCDFPLH